MNALKSTLLALVAMLPMVVQAQKFITKDSQATFYSHAPLEDITAVNEQVSSVIDFENQKVVVKMLMKHFHFENALMQEHFNENYIESEKYPNATFSGTYTSSKAIDPGMEGSYTLEITGEVELHGVKQAITTDATLNIADKDIKGNTVFILKPKDFNIEIPSLVVKNIAEDIEVTVDLTFEK